MKSMVPAYVDTIQCSEPWHKYELNIKKKNPDDSVLRLSYLPFQ
jgi:hypothetical protein